MQKRHDGEKIKEAVKQDEKILQLVFPFTPPDIGIDKSADKEQPEKHC